MTVAFERVTFPAPVARIAEPDRCCDARAGADRRHGRWAMRGTARTQDEGGGDENRRRPLTADYRHEEGG